MTPHEFITKWRGNALKESAGSQSHFNDLCALFGILDQSSADSLVADHRVTSYAPATLLSGQT